MTRGDGWTRAVAAAGALSAATFAVAVSVAACREVPDDRAAALAGSAAAPGVSAAAPQRAMYGSAPAAFAQLVDDARHGVVGIRAAAPVKSGPAAMFPGAPDQVADVALGTGFLVEAQGLYVLTNEHVAAAAADLRVVLEGGIEVPAKLVGRDPRLDLALLSLVPAAGSGADAASLGRLRGLPLGESDDLRVGDWLVVLGDAFGDEVTASVGVVSATGRTGATSFAGGGRGIAYRTLLQTDARVTRGNSGGPVIDTAGQVVGVALASGDRVGELSFVIPASRVREVIAPLRDRGDVARSWLGANASPPTDEQAATLGLSAPTGALITEVKPASPAARAGLRAGDVIVRWAGHEVDTRSLPAIIAATPLGTTVDVGVWRDRAETTVQVVTAKMPE